MKFYTDVGGRTNAHVCAYKQHMAPVLRACCAYTPKACCTYSSTCHAHVAHTYQRYVHIQQHMPCACCAYTPKSMLHIQQHIPCACCAYTPKACCTYSSTCQARMLRIPSKRMLHIQQHMPRVACCAYAPEVCCTYNGTCHAHVAHAHQKHVAHTPVRKYHTRACSAYINTMPPSLYYFFCPQVFGEVALLA